MVTSLIDTVVFCSSMLAVSPSSVTASSQPIICTNSIAATIVTLQPTKIPGNDIVFSGLIALTIVKSPGKPA